MPHIVVKLWPGRTDEIKGQLAKRIANTVAEELNVDMGDVSVGAKQVELSAEIADIEKYLNSVNKNLLEDLCNQSMVVLKDKLARKYEGNSSRKNFNEDNLWKEPYDVLAEYPVILSTTFSSRNSLNSDVV